MSRRKNTQTIEERNFQVALISLELHFEGKAALGPNSMVDVKKTVDLTLNKSLNKAEVRYFYPSLYFRWGRC